MAIAAVRTSLQTTTEEACLIVTPLQVMGYKYPTPHWQSTQHCIQTQGNN